MVGIDALINFKPLILSKNVGLSMYLKENVSAFLIDKLSEKSLAEKIIRAIKARGRHKEIASQARTIYEDKFSEKIFLRNLFEYLDY